MGWVGRYGRQTGKPVACPRLVCQRPCIQQLACGDAAGSMHKWCCLFGTSHCVVLCAVSVQRVFRLPDLWVRPGLGGKGRKMPGTLEAHQNGFR
jgi:hypothetical protein